MTAHTTLTGPVTAATLAVHTMTASSVQANIPEQRTV